MNLRPAVLIAVLSTSMLTGCGRLRRVAPEDTAGLVVSSGEGERNALAAEVRRFLAASQYDSLEAMAADLRSTQSQFVDGTARLRVFYLGAGKVATESNPLLWPRQVRQLREWTNARPQSVTAWIALAYGLDGYAWDARGRDGASTVTASAKVMMMDRLQEADNALAAARALPTSCPGWWQVALRLADLEGWDRERYDSTFREAVAYAPGFEPYYFYRALHLLPRWYGRPGEWEAYADSLADALPPPEGDMMYARMSWYVLNTIGSDTFFEKNQLSWTRINRGYTALIASHPASLELQSQVALLAGVAGDTTEMRARFTRLGNRVDLGVWGSREYFAYARRKALAYGQ